MVERSRINPELPKETLQEEGKQLIDNLFDHLNVFDGYKVAAAAAYPKAIRKLEFRIGSFEFQMISKISNVTQTLDMTLTANRESQKQQIIRKLRIIHNDFLPEVNEISYEEKEGDMVFREKNNKRAINKIQAIINALEKRKPAYRSI